MTLQWGSALDQRHSVARDAFTTACKSKAIGGGRFDADLRDFEMEVVREMSTHSLDIRSHFRTLCNNGGIDIADVPIVLGQQIAGVVEEDAAGLIFPAQITGGKVSADVA